MPNLRHPVEAGFQIQYTDEARLQLSRLDHRTCTSVQEKLHVIAAVDPYAHGRADPSSDHRDRRIVDIEKLLVTFWISATVKIITIVSIREGEDGRNLTIMPTPPPSMEVSPEQGDDHHTSHPVKAGVQ